MFSRVFKAIAILSVVLHLTDCLVLGVVHHHHDKSCTVATHNPAGESSLAEAGKVPHGCGHTHCVHIAATPSQSNDGDQFSRNSRHDSSVDDCALCRHLSQARASVDFAPIFTPRPLEAAVVEHSSSSALLVFAACFQSRGPPLVGV